MRALGKAVVKSVKKMLGKRRGGEELEIQRACEVPIEKGLLRTHCLGCTRRDSPMLKLKAIDADLCRAFTVMTSERVSVHAKIYSIHVKQGSLI